MRTEGRFRDRKGRKKETYVPSELKGNQGNLVLLILNSVSLAERAREGTSVA